MTDRANGLLYALIPRRKSVPEPNAQSGKRRPIQPSEVETCAANGVEFDVYWLSPDEMQRLVEGSDGHYSAIADQIAVRVKGLARRRATPGMPMRHHSTSAASGTRSASRSQGSCWRACCRRTAPHGRRGRRGIGRKA